MLKEKMKRHRSIGLGALLALAALLAVIVGRAADAAMVQVGPLVLRADGGFTPQELPRNAYAPIRFQGHADINSRTAEPVPPLQQMKLDFDRDGRITTNGLAVCSPTQIEGTSPQAARQTCKGAIVGTGHVEVTVTLPGSDGVDIQSPLTLFNGPRQAGNVTVLAHAQATFPKLETHVVVIPVERRGGAFSYRATVDMPKIAEGYGALTHVDGKLGRLYRFGGKERSYTSARCSDGILETQGRLLFAEGTVILGSIFKACNPLD
jgi:hypothetical protein